MYLIVYGLDKQATTILVSTFSLMNRSGKLLVMNNNAVRD